jgi:two-component system, OmpR family, KDP operon response regulator KdpE
MAGTWSLRQLFTRSAVAVRGNPRACSSDVIGAGDFKINTAERTATVRGETLPLTSEEFDVLVFMTTHPQRVVTPRTTLTTSWTKDASRQTEFLKALLSLQRKLQALGGRQYLRTEPWVIYRFDPDSSVAA